MISFRRIFDNLIKPKTTERESDTAMIRKLILLVIVPILELMLSIVISTILIDGPPRNRVWFVGITWGIMYFWFSIPGFLICVQANGAWVLNDPIFGKAGPDGQRGVFEGYHLVYPWEKIVRSDIDVTKKIEVKGTEGVYTYPSGKQIRIAWFLKWSVTRNQKHLPRFRNEEKVIESIIRATIEQWLQGKIGSLKKEEEIGYGKKAIDSLQKEFKEIFEGEDNPVEADNGISIEEISITDIEQPKAVQESVNLAQSMGEISKAVQVIVDASGGKITHKEAWDIIMKQTIASAPEGRTEMVNVSGLGGGNNNPPGKGKGKGKKGGK